MKNLNSSQRSYLKGKAHPLEPIIYIGKNGLSVGTLNAINSALSKRELIKIKFQEFKDDKQDGQGTFNGSNGGYFKYHVQC